VRLHTDHCTLEPEGVCHERVTQLRLAGHNPAVEQMYAAVSESSDHAYPVWKVSTLPVPLESDADVDATADRLTVWVCGCDDHWYRGTADGDGGMAPPEEWDDCKHVRSVAREKRAEHDESQRTL